MSGNTDKTAASASLTATTGAAPVVAAEAASAEVAPDAWKAAAELSNQSPQDFVRGAQWALAQKGK